MSSNTTKQISQKLRWRAHKQCLKELKERIVRKPKPTKEELFLGAYIEMLEPQIRNAVRVINRRGYTSWSSGFYGIKQCIDGFFTIDLKAKDDLKRIGVSVREEKNGYTMIEFSSKAKRLNEIKKTWDVVARILPKRKPGHPSDSAGATLFRKNPLREAFYTIGELEYSIARNI